MPRQKVSNLINAIEQGKVSDEEFAILKRLVEKRGHEEAQVTVTPVDTVQHWSPCPLNSEMLPDVCFKLENNEGRMDPERGELESPSAGTGLETPGQQCPPNGGTWETGRTTADDVLTAGVGPNQGGGISSPTMERVDSRAVRTTANITILQQGNKPKDEEKGSEENKQFDPGGKGEQAPLWKAAVTSIFFFFLWRAFGHGRLVACVSCFFCLCVPVCSVFQIIVLFRWSLLSELKSMRADQVPDVRNRRASIFSPINSLKTAKTNNTRLCRSENALR